MSPRVAILAGDGIGPEVTAEAVATLDPGLELVEIDAGAERYLRTGEVLSDEEFETISNCDALLFGAVGDPRVPDGMLERGILLKLRRELDLYVNLRPFPEIDIAIVRENTQGLYYGGGERKGSVATEISWNTEDAVERCARYSFELAEQRKARVTLVHKSNVLVNAGSLWRDATERVGKAFPNVAFSYEHADAAAYHMIKDPSRFDVILTDNLFGDLLSDVAAALAGGLERAASANIHPDPATRPTRCVGLFEPVHGSAPDIAGKRLADATAAVRAARMMTEELAREVART